MAARSSSGAAEAVMKLFEQGTRNDSSVFAALRQKYNPAEIFAGLQTARLYAAVRDTPEGKPADLNLKSGREACKSLMGETFTERAGKLPKPGTCSETGSGPHSNPELSSGEERKDISASSSNEDNISILEKLLQDPGATCIPPSLKIHDVSPLMYACSTYDEELAVKIVRFVRRVAESEECMHEDTHMKSDALGRSRDLKKRRVEISSKAITLKALVNEVHDYQYRPLHYACEASMPLLVAELVYAGAGLEDQTIDLQLQKGSVQAGGRRPLHFAARVLGDDGIAMIRTLLAAGADPTSEDFDGNTPYVLACIRHGPASQAAELLRAALVSKSSKASDDNTELKISIPTRTWLSEKAKADQEAGNARVKDMWFVPPFLREVFPVQGVLSVKECLSLIESVVEFTSRHGWLSDRHRGYATTDVRAAKMPKVDEWVRRIVGKRLFPLLSKRFGFEESSFGFRDLFFVKYSAKPGEQNSVGPHRDGSVLSFNILLNDPSEFDGGGTWFDHTSQTHHICQGDVLVHSGKLRHAGMPITRGERFILVGFVDAGLGPNGEGALELHFSDH